MPIIPEDSGGSGGVAPAAIAQEAELAGAQPTDVVDVAPGGSAIGMGGVDAGGAHDLPGATMPENSDKVVAITTTQNNVVNALMMMSRLTDPKDNPEAGTGSVDGVYQVNSPDAWIKNPVGEATFTPSGWTPPPQAKGSDPNAGKGRM